MCCIVAVKVLRPCSLTSTFWGSILRSSSGLKGAKLWKGRWGGKPVMEEEVMYQTRGGREFWSNVFIRFVVLMEVNFDITLFSDVNNVSFPLT